MYIWLEHIEEFCQYVHIILTKFPVKMLMDMEILTT